MRFMFAIMGAFLIALVFADHLLNHGHITREVLAFFS